MGKKIIFNVLIIFLMFSPASGMVFAQNINLINNPSVETSQNSLPQDWSKESWGKNTVSYQYLSTGHTGSKSLYLKVSDYQSGDAKWVFNPVNVSASTNYLFTDYYKSTAVSDVVVRLIDSSNKQTYIDLGETQPSANWTQFSATFKTKPTTVKVTVLHLLYNDGELTTDDYSLYLNPGAVITYNVPNNSVETVSTINPNLPDSWTSDAWGTNNAQFDYLNTGYDSNRSVKVTISSYTNGDAKWMYNPQPLTKGQYYEFQDYYQSDVSTEVAVMYTKRNGSQAFLELKNAPVSTGWNHYTAYFTVPNNAVNVSVIHFLSMAGYLVTDDYSVTPAVYKPLTRALLTLTFDNGYEDNSTTAVPTMDALGIKSTQCFSTEYLEAENHTWDYIVKQFYDDGHEICSHSAHHEDITNLTASQLDYEYSYSQNYLDDLIGVPDAVQNYISPFGSYSDTAFTEAQKYYTSFRSTDDGYNTRDNMNFYNLHVQNILKTTTAAKVQSWVNNAIANKSWLVIVYHRVATKKIGKYDTTPTLFDAQMQAIVNSKITVLTTAQAIQEITPQLDK